jgi:hypothetical protein
MYMSLALDKYQYERREFDGLYLATVPIPVTGGPSPNPTYEDFIAGAEELNDSYHVVRHKETGLHIGVGIVNADKAETVWIPSTSFSDIVMNPGNAAEVILSAKATGRRYVSITNFGVSETSNLSLESLLQLAISGRYSSGNHEDPESYKAMPELTWLVDAMEKAKEPMPDHVTANGEADRTALGVALALDQNSLHTMYLNNMPGMAPKGSYDTRMVSRDIKDRLASSIGETDQWAITGELKDEMRQLMPKVYRKSVHRLGVIARTYARGAPNHLLAYSRAFGRKDSLDKPLQHAALQDTVAALLRHEVKISLQVGEKSKLNDAQGTVMFGAAAMNAAAPYLRSEDQRIEVLIGPGDHDRHTAKPHERWATELYTMFGGAVNLFAGQQPNLGIVNSRSAEAS